MCIKPLRQVVTATGEAALAATEMEKYLSKQRRKTGLETEMTAHRAKAHKTQDSGNIAGISENAGLLDEKMKGQLSAVFERMNGKLILEIHPDQRDISTELREYMRALSGLTDKLRVRELPVSEEAGLPYVRVLHEDGSPSGITFHGVPGGHEFTSFVLGLYNAAGPGQAVPDEVKEKIGGIDAGIPITIMVSLSCTMCPELVTAAGRIATLNPEVKVDIYDLNHFPELKDRYNVMSVPCFVIGEQAPEFGKKNVEELTELLLKR